ncbi:Hsp20/alpha crystallin family protein [Acidimangrovimonas pyrenivorans]|uniref:Hsp20/alpha crystallin family protein n=1 Tax=Acidimangrovimonas pyrenivorans TaxID=2030798 RepID=A0ABV7AID8_9RHOB
MAKSKSEKTDVKVTQAPAGPTPGARPEVRPESRLSPLTSLRGEIDRLFEDFDWPDFRLPGHRRRGIGPFRQIGDLWSDVPAMDLVERDGEYELQAELPGVAPGEVEVKLSEGMLTIKGEKSAERSEEKEDYHLRERSYGSFQRSFGLPSGVDEDKVAAKFVNGVLTVTLPKSAEARQKERKIEVKSA